MRRLPLVVLPLLVLLACSRPKPSNDYADAQASWDSITTRIGDDAYADPEMERISGLLDKVPAASSDAAAAAALKAKIASERARIAEEAKKRQADLDVLRAPIPTPNTPAPTPDAAPPPKPKEDPVEESGQPQVGLAYDQFAKRFGACFSEGEMITVSNLGVRARAFSLVSNEECAKKHADFTTKWVLFNEGKIIGMVPRDSVKQVSQTADGGAPPAARPDAGR
jgi:hypothetical protein